MMVAVRIERDGAALDALTLGPGEHGIGRAPDNAVVLCDKAVSFRHALLRVGETEAELLDAGSLNGIFVDGEKVGKVVFTRPLAADFCGLRLVFTPQAPPKKRLALPAGQGLATRPAIRLAMAALALCAFLAAWLPDHYAVNAWLRTEALQRGALLARFLAGENVVPLQARLPDQLRTASVAAENGVRGVLVADPYGKVLAPAKEMGSVLDASRAAQAAKAQGLTLWTSPDGDTVLACPIRDGATLLGLAVVVFNPDQALSPPSRAGGLVLGLFAAALAWVAAAWCVERLSLGPMRRMAEDIGVALKSGAAALSVVPASREAAELKSAVERTLLLVPTDASGRAGSSKAPDAPVPGHAAGSAAASQSCAADAALAASSTRQGTSPSEEGPPAEAGEWCLIDPASYRLVGWSPAFAGRLACRDLAAPVHLLSALADPALLAAVADLLDDPAGNAVHRVGNQPLAARKEPGADPGLIRVRLTETP
jgi:hypothetical protein